MTSELSKRIINIYKDAGFEFEEYDTYIVFKNSFSVHFVFLCNETADGIVKAKVAYDILEKYYFKENQLSDLNWSYYAVFMFDEENSKEFNNIKENIESDFRLSRKFVIGMSQTHLLPPLYITIESGIISEKPIWENQWIEAVGEVLYQKIVDSPKNKIETIVKEFIDAKIDTSE